MTKLTQARVRELFHYNTNSGVLSWKVRKSQSVKPGAVAGSAWDESGRRRVGIDGKYFYVSRIVWLFVHGWLPEYLDHKDGNPANDKVSNLRPATFSQNQMNRGHNNNHSLRMKNIYKYKDKYLVRIMADGESHAKYFSTIPEAKKHLSKLRPKLHGSFARSE